MHLRSVFWVFLVRSTMFKQKPNVSLNAQTSSAKVQTVEENSTVLSGKDVSLREFLYKQIDYMMTVESREVPAEGRRGTHVEVHVYCKFKPTHERG